MLALPLTLSTPKTLQQQDSCMSMMSRSTRLECYSESCTYPHPYTPSTHLSHLPPLTPSPHLPPLTPSPYLPHPHTPSPHLSHPDTLIPCRYYGTIQSLPKVSGSDMCQYLRETAQVCADSVAQYAPDTTSEKTAGPTSMVNKGLSSCWTHPH